MRESGRELIAQDKPQCRHPAIVRSIHMGDLSNSVILQPEVRS
jgi:hypothetical protein